MQAGHGRGKHLPSGLGLLTGQVVRREARKLQGCLDARHALLGVPCLQLQPHLPPARISTLLRHM